MATTPWAGWVTLTIEIVSPVSGNAVSLARTARAVGPAPCETVNVVSFTAFGGSFTDSTVSRIVPVSLSRPSLARYVKLSVPL